MPMLPKQTLAIRGSEDIVTIRRATRERLVALQFSLVDQTKMVTAASELARNALDYGGGGTAILEEVEQQGRLGLKITFADHGPGIPDVDLAMQDGFSTSKGLGLGLGGAKRLVNEFEIHSAQGYGTTVSIIRWR
jgi:serine/threonine-protein kinase RsbT